jgi:uncharacterized protein
VLLLAAVTGCPETGGGAPAPSGSAAAAEVEAAATRLCDSGDNAACEKLMGMYLSGDRVPRSEAKAAELARRLCESGRRYFCPTFALVLYEGRGLPQDRARALTLFADTCGEDPKACSEYGSLYAGGRGVAKDPKLAQLLLGLACKHGEATACDELGRL